MAEGQQNGRKGGAIYATVTGLLVLACAVLAYLGYGREAPVNQHVVEGPPQQPSEAQRDAAAKALLAVGVAEERLRQVLATMDPPHCPAGTEIDQAKLEKVRTASKADIDGWQKLLTQGL